MIAVKAHPLLHLLLTQPRLLADHVEAYAELVATEIGNVSVAWKRRALLNAVALCCLGVAAVLAGVALMLWAVLLLTYKRRGPWWLRRCCPSLWQRGAWWRRARCRATAAPWTTCVGR